MGWRPALLAGLAAAVGFAAAAADLARTPGETDIAFTRRALGLGPGGTVNVLATDWNGAPTLFADYQTGSQYPDRLIFALQRQPSGTWRAVRVATGEHEGDVPRLVAVGFANADRDAARELIVLLAWNQQHGDVSGTLYDTLILDDAKPGQVSLNRLKVSEHFGMECDCDWSDGTRKRYRYKTIAAIKAELKRLGY